jgi:L-arabinose isomerase
MDYLAKVTIEGVVYEAHVDVREYDGELEADLSTSLVYIDDKVHLAADVSDVVIDELLDEAADMYRMDDGADAAYEAWRDA